MAETDSSCTCWSGSGARRSLFLSVGGTQRATGERGKRYPSPNAVYPKPSAETMTFILSSNHFSQGSASSVLRELKRLPWVNVGDLINPC